MLPSALRLSVLVLALSSGCLAAGSYVWVRDLPDTVESPNIMPGDRISVVVKNQAQLTGEFEVRPNGTYIQPLLGEISVAGLSPHGASVQLAAQLKGIVVNPLVSVSVAQPRTLKIPVLGEVRTNGLIEVPHGTRMIELIARAGGLSEFADKDSIYVIRTNPRHVRIRFDYAELIAGSKKALDFEFRDGDAVVVE